MFLSRIPPLWALVQRFAMDTPFTLQVHPDAAKNFDETAERLLAFISKMPIAGLEAAGFRPDIHVSAHLGEKDTIGEIKFGMVDYRRREVAKVFHHDGQLLGLVDEAFKSFEALAIRVQQLKTVRSYLSTRCILEVGFEWVQKRHVGETEESFTSFVLREAATLVKEVEIWLPLSRVYLQSELTIGRVRFRTLSREMLDDCLDKTRKKFPPERMAELEVSFNRTRSLFQGCAAATIKLTAEITRAQEVAEEEAEYSIAALRFFHASNMTPYIRCCCTFAGAERVSKMSALTVSSGMIDRWEDRIVPNLDSTWVLSEAEIRNLQNSGLDALSQLLARDQRSKFEDEVLDAILIYSRNSLLDDPASRLIYILAAVESVLLRDSNEPIQKNIGERLAFIVGETVDERMSIRDTVTCVYSVRSAFLHHGHALGEMDALELFMKYVWRGFFWLIMNREKFQTKQELIDALERRKME
jgi:hypothetical protein